MRRRRSLTELTLFVTVCVSACSGGSGTTGTANQNPPPTGQQPPGQQPPSGNTNAITVRNGGFDPAATTVTAGTTVTWTWDACRDDGYGATECTDHSVSFDDGPTSPTQSRGTFSRQFNAVGTFGYRCKVHSGMAGQVIAR
jgi:plastocyanin